MRGPARRRSLSWCRIGSTTCRGRVASSRTGRNQAASAERVYAHWALDIYDYDDKGTREVGFVTRPLHLPKERLSAGDASVHLLMDRVEAIDREFGVPFGWFFLMTRGNRVEPEVG